MPDCAVVIGISRYPDLTTLKGPENDAQAFFDWLTTKPFQPLNPLDVEMILSSKFTGRNPQTGDIDSAFDRILAKPPGPNGTIGQRLYIFMAGHGFAPNVDDAALLMANAAKGRTGYHIPGRPYANWFRESFSFEEVVLFMDCCRENHERATLKNLPWERQPAMTPARRCYGLATEWSRDSREIPVTLPGAAAPVWRGRFSLALMEGLLGLAANPTTRSITGTSLSEFVYNRVTSTTAGTQEIQEPKFDVDSTAEIVFDPVAPPPFTIRAAIPAGGAAPTLQDGALNVLPPNVQNSAFHDWNVYRGLYRLVRPDGTAQTIELTEGGGTVNV